MQQSTSTWMWLDPLKYIKGGSGTIRHENTVPDSTGERAVDTAHLAIGDGLYVSTLTPQQRRDVSGKQTTPIVTVAEVNVDNHTEHCRPVIISFGAWLASIFIVHTNIWADSQ